MIKYVNYLLVYLLLLFVSSCDMPFDDSYHVEIPHQESVPMSIDLNVITNGQTILINGNSDIAFSLSALDKNVSAAIFTLGSKKWEVKASEGVINILQDEIPAGNYTLECEMYVKTNTGSIADQFDQEFYYGKMSWPVIVDYSIETPELISQSITNDKYLKLTWMKPMTNHLVLKGYRLWYSNDNIDGYRNITIAPDQTSYIDRLYVGEKCEYSLVALFEKENSSSEIVWPMGTLKMENKITTYSTINSDGNILINWDTPYRCKAVITKDGKKYMPQEEERYITFATPPITENIWSSFFEVLVQIQAYDEPNKNIFSRYSKFPYYAKQIGEPWSKFTWNKKENVVYVQYSNKLISYQLPDYKLIATKDFNSSYITDLCSSPTNELVAIRVDNDGVNDNTNIYILNGKSMNEVCHIEANDMKYNGLGRQHLMYMTNDNKLVYFSEQNGNMKGIACNLYTGVKEKSFSLNTKYGAAYPTISSDGKTMFYEEDNDPYMVKLDNYEVKEIKSLNNERAGNFFIFNPQNNNEAMIDRDEKIYVVDVTTGNTVREFALPATTGASCCDPVSGYILASAQDRIYVISSQDGAILFQLPNNSNTLLINNYLVSDYGLIMNIKNYLIK